MILRKFIALTLSICLLVLTGPAGKLPAVVQAAPLASLPASDIYGYAASSADPITLDVCGNMGATEIPFGSPESFSDFISFTDFTFPFYENLYPAFRASINGLIGFSDSMNLGGTDDHFPIPADIAPNDLIAPFWTDLELSTGDPTGKVCYANYPADGTHGKYLAVEWNNVELNGVTGIFTFQVLMFENGNIQFQYPAIIPKVDNATVGIEDSQGVFGLQVFYNEPGLQPNQTILITPPVTHPGGRFVPTFSSGFSINSEADLKFTLKNISGTQAQNFELAIGDTTATGCSWNSLGWDVAILQGTTQLANNGNACPDIQIAANSQVEITAHIRAPQSAQVGDSKQFTLTALPSPAGEFAPVSMVLQAAVPASFAQAYVSDNPMMKLLLTSGKEPIFSDAGDLYTGKNLTFDQTSSGGYFYVWEYHQTKISFLEGTLFDRAGNRIRYSFTITTGVNEVYDQEPAVASTPNGNMAVVWVRNGNEVRMRVFAPDGYPIGGEILLATSSQISAPRIAADRTNRFYVIWNQTNAGLQDVYLEILDSKGIPVKSSTPLTHSSTSGYDYFSPTITSLTGGGVAIAYSVDKSDTQPLAYQIISADGSLLASDQQINYDAPRTREKDFVQLSNGNLLLSWIDDGMHHIFYTLLTYNGSWNAGDINELTVDYQIGAMKVSVTSDDTGHGIITWAEFLGNRTLSYALIDASGNLLTTPMIFLSGTGVDSNAAGQGNARYSNQSLLFIPLIKR